MIIIIQNPKIQWPLLAPDVTPKSGISEMHSCILQWNRNPCKHFFPRNIFSNGTTPIPEGDFCWIFVRRRHMEEASEEFHTDSRACLMRDVVEPKPASHPAESPPEPPRRRHTAGIRRSDCGRSKCGVSNSPNSRLPHYCRVHLFVHQEKDIRARLWSFEVGWNLPSKKILALSMGPRGAISLGMLPVIIGLAAAIPLRDDMGNMSMTISTSVPDAQRYEKETGTRCGLGWGCCFFLREN